MNFLEKLNYLLDKNDLNKNSLSKACNIPYTTIDGWYKKGYEGLKLTTLRKLANFFETSLDFWVDDNAQSTTPLLDDKLFISKKDEIELLRDYRTLNKGTQNYASGLIKGMAYSEKIANSKGETIVLRTPDDETLLEVLSSLDPEAVKNILEFLKQQNAEQE